MQFDVLSSDGSTVYNVTVEMADGNVWASCTCKAGRLGKLCKHQFGILAGQSSLLASPDDESRDELRRFVAKISDTACACLVAEILVADAGMKEHKRRLDTAKKSLEKRLSGHR